MGEMKTCAFVNCGNQFLSRRRNHTYCSETCGSNASYHRRNKVNQESRNCVTCGIEFKPKKSVSVACSRECYCKHQNSKRVWVPKVHPPTICQHCTQEFNPNKSGQKYCSQKCRDASYKANRSNLPKVKKCKQCGTEFKPYMHKNEYCDEKCRDVARYHRNSHKRQEAIFVRKYGINYEQRNKMVQDQNGKCAICECELTWDHRKTTSVNVDHCHETGTVHGILCGMCNKGMGCLQEDPAVLGSAVNYLIETGKLSRKEDWLPLARTVVTALTKRIDDE